MKSLLNSIFFILLYNISGQGQLGVQNKIVQIFKDQGIHHSVFSIHTHNISKGQQLVSYRADEYMIPASSMKVITTFSTLDILDDDFKYETLLGYTGLVESDGTLKGNIIIKGSGDPSLGSFREELNGDFLSVLNNMTNAIKSAGIKCIDGHILVDNSRFENGGTHPGWSWKDVGNYYGAGAHGLNINENEYLVHFNRDVPIDSLVNIASTDPRIPGMSIDCRVRLDEAGTGDNAYIYGGEGFYQKIIKGTIPAGKGRFTIRGSLPDPPWIMASLLAQKLEKQGISHLGPMIGANPNSINQIKTFRSKTLKNLVRLANARSINLYCESFLRSICDTGSMSDALVRLRRHIDSIGLDTFSIIQKDGSGLHSRNVITSRFFTQFLTHYYKKWKSNAIELLPRASFEGTVSGFLRHKKSKGKAWLKSGYIGGVLTYTGYIKNKDGEIIAISIMANNFQKEIPKIREICEKIIEEVYLL
ncbi:MAG: D-alanyl-D-alanine carboxypeptidase/D-alanyl-D-alanine-endopeptidase [Saprospiraceae bacterium]|nr:D-alanyl-D-alanine carboxypeptidase/D-alanyl-D-alanine-endopeptidase [Saprospiraceae bacterium]